MAKAVLQSKRSGKKSEAVLSEPKKLSKVGEWMRAHPSANGVILDMRAVMK